MQHLFNWYLGLPIEQQEAIATAFGQDHRHWVPEWYVEWMADVPRLWGSCAHLDGTPELRIYVMHD